MKTLLKERKNKVEDWLIRWDFKDNYCILSSSEIRKEEINSYLRSSISWVEDDHDDRKLKDLCETISENFCRGIDANLKKKILKYAKD